MYRNGMLAMVAVVAGRACSRRAPSAATAPPITARVQRLPHLPRRRPHLHRAGAELQRLAARRRPHAASAGGGRKHPLIVMLHGFGNDKHEWESTTTGRRRGQGALEQPLLRRARLLRPELHRARLPTGPAGGDRAPRRRTPRSTLSPPDARAARCTSRAATSRSRTRSGSRRSSPRVPRRRPGRVAVTGGSYGGGESWLQASQPTWTSRTPRTRRCPCSSSRSRCPSTRGPTSATRWPPTATAGPADDLAGRPGTPTRRRRATRSACRSPATSPACTRSGTRTARSRTSRTDPPSAGAEGPIRRSPAWNGRLTGTGDP